MEDLRIRSYSPRGPLADDVPQGLKPATIYGHSAARLKSCPFKATLFLV